MDHNACQHEHECEYCDFETTDAANLKMHLEDKHYHKCSSCDINLSTEGKLRAHICKVSISNPTFKSFYTRSWYDANGCNPVYCTVKNQDILWLHKKESWADKEAHCWKPSAIFGEPSEVDDIGHIQFDEHIQDSEVN